MWMHLDLVYERLEERHRGLRIGMCRKSFQKSTDISFGQDFIAACGVEFNQSDGGDIPWIAGGVALHQFLECRFIQALQNQ